MPGRETVRRDLLPVALISAASFAVAVAAILTTGGPTQAAKERRDQGRVNNLNSLSRAVECRAEETGALPESIAGIDGCDMKQTSDPTTGEPYRYERLNDLDYRICATFESPDTLDSYRGTIDPDDGCISYTWKPRKQS